MNEELKTRIYVLDDGFVGVCESPDPCHSGFWISVQNWRTIRVWGTEGVGLGRLVKGPTDQTVLDHRVKKADIPVRAIIKVLEAEDKPWKKDLSSDTSRCG